MNRHDPACAGVALEAQDLGTGDSRYLDCPFCGRKDKFSITRTGDGVLYHCFSASCGAAGFIPDHGAVPRAQGVKSRPRKRYIGHVAPASGEDYKYFRDRFGLRIKVKDYPMTEGFWEIFVTHRDEYLFPILDRSGHRVGEIIRQPVWGGDPEPPRKGVPGKAKALTYIEHGAHRVSWFDGDKDLVVLVEDHVSAAKVQHATGYTAVAILGNTISAEALLSVAQVNPIRMVWWLDSDMVETAYRLNQKFGGFFNDSRVVTTQDDPKDLDDDDIREVLFD